MAVMIVYAVLGSFQLLPLVKGRLVVFPNLVPKGFSVWNQTRILFVFCFCIEDVACRRRKRGFRRREKGRASGFPFLFRAFLPLPPLFVPAIQSTSPFFCCLEIWQVGERPPTCYLPTHTQYACVTRLRMRKHRSHA